MNSTLLLHWLQAYGIHVNVNSYFEMMIGELLSITIAEVTARIPAEYRSLRISHNHPDQRSIPHSTVVEYTGNYGRAGPESNISK